MDVIIEYFKKFLKIVEAFLNALGITPEHYAVLIAVYMALDGMGTACNLTGDGAIALIVDRFRAGGKAEAAR